jgi:hypothetical protein
LWSLGYGVMGWVVGCGLRQTRVGVEVGVEFHQADWQHLPEVMVTRGEYRTSLRIKSYVELH